MDEGYDRSPVERRDEYSGGRNGDDRPAAAPAGRRARSRDRSPPRRRSRSRSRERRYPRSRSRDRRRDDDRDRRRSPDSYRRRRDDDDRYPGASTRGGYGGSSRAGGYGGRSSRSGRGSEPDGRSSNREALAQDAIRTSKKENRLYVGNLSFQVRWHDLKEFCQSVGNVVFAEIIQLPNGMSKGCGIVEYATREEAMRAISELNEVPLMGRTVYLREDREDEARYGSAAVSSRQSFPGASYQTERGGGRPAPPANVPAVFAPPGPRGLFVTGMSPNIGWQDLKDLFRAAGNVIRADLNIDRTTGLSKGTGVVVMESKSEAEAAIAMFNGYEFDGGRLEVREDRFYHINAARGAHGGLGGRGPPRGSHRDSPPPPGRNTDDLYSDYTGPDGGSANRAGGRGYSEGGYEGSGYSAPRGPPRESRGPPRGDLIPAAPSMQIFVRNLPWSTSNEDLVELFQTTGTVQEAEVIWENGRSRGTGIVQFASIEEAETAIAKFQGYEYGGRPLGLAFNARWKDFSAAPAGRGSNDAPMDVSTSHPEMDHQGKTEDIKMEP